MNPSLEIEGINVTILGAFNPQIFQPQWFATQGLIRAGEADNATVEFINSDASIFSLGWAKIEITRDRASFASNQSQNYELLRDLAASTFRLLRHSPITRMGINWVCHFRMPDENSWHKVGNVLVPKEPWLDITENPGMLDVSIQAQRPDKYSGRINISVQPSMTVKLGVYIMINDDFILQNGNGGETACDKMIAILNSELTPSFERRKKITDKLLSL